MHRTVVHGGFGISRPIMCDPCATRSTLSSSPPTSGRGRTCGVTKTSAFQPIDHENSRPSDRSTGRTSSRHDSNRTSSRYHSGQSNFVEVSQRPIETRRGITATNRKSLRMSQRSLEICRGITVNNKNRRVITAANQNSSMYHSDQLKPVEATKGPIKFVEVSQQPILNSSRLPQRPIETSRGITATNRSSSGLYSDQLKLVEAS